MAIVDTRKHTFVTNLQLVVARVPLGAFFVFAGWGKISSPKGVEGFVTEKFNALSPPWLPEWFSQPYGQALPYAELIAGSLLILGLLGRLGALTIALMLTSFIVALGIENDKLPFNPNLIYVGLALLLASLGPGDWSIDAMLFKKKRRSSDEEDE